MKAKALLSVLLIITVFAAAQDPVKILQNAYTKCLTVKNGKFEVQKVMKYMTEKDTARHFSVCYFSKSMDDTLYPLRYHYKFLSDDKPSSDELYTGQELVYLNHSDNTAVLTPVKEWATEVKESVERTDHYPFVSRSCAPLPHDSDFFAPESSFGFAGEEKIGKWSCYHVRQIQFPEKHPGDMFTVLRIETNFWINKEDSIPVQYSAHVSVLFNDTMYQYEKYTLSQYQLNRLTDTAQLSMASVPPSYRITNYAPEKRIEPLPVDTLAPDWHLTSWDNKQIALADLRGRLVLIDFFYKSCYPCLMAIPVLQSLHEKYKDRGLQIVGINPFDSKENDLDKFIEKRGITYPVLLAGKDLPKMYRVSGYPTLFLIDREGKILYRQTGYGAESEKVLEELIKKHL